MPRSSAWNERIIRSSGHASGPASRGPGTDDRGWTQHSVRRSVLPDVSPESLLAKGGLNRHGISTGRLAEGTYSANFANVDARGDRMKRNTADNTRTVGDVLSALNEFAPFTGAADWDNVGHLVGRLDAPARRVMLAIDLTDAVADEALRRDVDLLVVYHPPIFKGIKQITPATDGPTTRWPELLAAGVSIIALHTALDAAVGGTNDLLLDCFDISERRPLEPAFVDEKLYKLAVFVPPNDVARLRTALAEAGAGVIGHYRECSFELAGRGTFRGDKTTNPAFGQSLQLEGVDEIRLEMVAPAARLAEVVRALYANHRYEEPAFDIYPLRQAVGHGQCGMGRVGTLRKPMRGDRLVHLLAKRVDVSNATVVGDLRRRFNAVITAAGSFGVRSFRDPHALVITGEFKHHDALDLHRRAITAIHLGHFESEQPLLDYVAKQIATRLRGVRPFIARADRSPFHRL